MIHKKSQKHSFWDLVSEKLTDEYAQKMREVFTWSWVSVQRFWLGGSSVTGLYLFLKRELKKP